jgi:hypothetical protein
VIAAILGLAAVARRIVRRARVRSSRLN